MTTHTIQLTQQELSTVLAALRYYEHASPSIRDREILSWMDDLASSGGEVEPLELGEIDNLCVKLNCQPKQPSEAQQPENPPIAKIANDSKAANIVCPTEPQGELSGCGSSNVSDPDDEGFRDCYDCGLFFKSEYQSSQPIANGATEELSKLLSGWVEDRIHADYRCYQVLERLIKLVPTTSEEAEGLAEAIVDGDADELLELLTEAKQAITDRQSANEKFMAHGAQYISKSQA